MALTHFSDLVPASKQLIKCVENPVHEAVCTQLGGMHNSLSVSLSLFRSRASLTTQSVRFSSKKMSTFLTNPSPCCSLGFKMVAGKNVRTVKEGKFPT